MFACQRNAIARALAFFGYTRFAAFLIVIIFCAPPGLPAETKALTCSPRKTWRFTEDEPVLAQTRWSGTGAKEA
jgi:hypothetical protein